MTNGGQSWGFNSLWSFRPYVPSKLRQKPGRSSSLSGSSAAPLRGNSPYGQKLAQVSALKEGVLSFVSKIPQFMSLKYTQLFSQTPRAHLLRLARP